MEIRPVFQSEQKYTLKTKPIPKLIGRVKLANFMEMPEKEFAYFIKKVENNPLFKKLAYPKKKEGKVISYKRPYRTDLSERFCELKEEIVPERSYFDIQPLLSNRGEIIQIIQKLGIDKLKQYFLYNKSTMTDERMSTLCGLEIEAVKSINALMDELSLRSEFYYPSNICSGEGVKYSKIASIEKDGSGGFVIAYFSPHLARGRYLINYEKLKALKRKGVFSEKDIKRIDRLLKQLEIINSRKSTIHKVIQNIIEHQSNFLESGRVEKLVPLSQKEVSLEINVNPSLVNRAIAGRSIDTPWQEEMPLRDFFPSDKDIRKNLIKEIILTEKNPHKDVEIKNLLEERHRVDVSPHLVSICRNELKIPSASKRNNNSYVRKT